MGAATIVAAPTLIKTDGRRAAADHSNGVARMSSASTCRAITLLVASGLALAACGSSAPTTVSGSSGVGSSTGRSGAVAGTPVISLKNVQFHPAVLRIGRGDSVTWKLGDAAIGTAHNVTSIGRAHFANSATKMAGTYTIQCNTAGTYAFECTIHPLSMQGRIIVS